MPKSDDELEKTVEPTSPKIHEYLVERLAPDPTAISGWHLLQIVGAIVIVYVIFFFLEKNW
jgi:hypothetical protein